MAPLSLALVSPASEVFLASPPFSPPSSPSSADSSPLFSAVSWAVSWVVAVAAVATSSATFSVAVALKSIVVAAATRSGRLLCSYGTANPRRVTAH